MHRSAVIGVALGVLLLVPAGLGQKQAGSAPARPATPAPSAQATGKTQEKAPRERKMKLEAETVDYDEETSTYIATLATVELPDSDATLRADRIVWNRAERWMRATGKPRMWDPQNEITADVIRADLNLKRQCRWQRLPDGPPQRMPRPGPGQRAAILASRARGRSLRHDRVNSTKTRRARPPATCGSPRRIEGRPHRDRGSSGL